MCNENYNNNFEKDICNKDCCEKNHIKNDCSCNQADQCKSSWCECDLDCCCKYGIRGVLRFLKKVTSQLTYPVPITVTVTRSTCECRMQARCACEAECKCASNTMTGTITGLTKDLLFISEDSRCIEPSSVVSLCNIIKVTLNLPLNSDQVALINKLFDDRCIEDNLDECCCTDGLARQLRKDKKKFPNAIIKVFTNITGKDVIEFTDIIAIGEDILWAYNSSTDIHNIYSLCEIVGYKFIDID